LPESFAPHIDFHLGFFREHFTFSHTPPYEKFDLLPQPQRWKELRWLARPVPDRFSAKFC